MELSIEKKLQHGIAAHKEGKLAEAERLYREILQSQPVHSYANHNLGLIAVSVNKTQAAIPLFKKALEANPGIEQFWISYIDALMKDRQFDNAKQVVEQAKNQGLAGKKLNTLESQLIKTIPQNEPKLSEQNKSHIFSQKSKKMSEEKKKKKKAKKQNLKASNPPQQLLSSLLEHYQSGRSDDAEKLALSITNEYPSHQFSWKVLGLALKKNGKVIDSLTAMRKFVQLAPQDTEGHFNLGVILTEIGKLDEAEASFRRAIALKNDFAEGYFNLGVILTEIGKLDEAEANYLKALELKPEHIKAHYNLGNIMKRHGRLNEAELSFKQAIRLKPDFAEAHNNLGNTLNDLARLDEAQANYKKAVRLKPDYAEAFWNIHGMSKTLKRAEYWIDRCLEVDGNYLRARIIKAVLRFYQGDGNNFEELMQSELKQHPYMRSFIWVLSLPYLPELHFNKFYFFDAIIRKSTVSKPFYEFGVWRGSSFKYLIKVFKKGYGFDTFTGLPEDWNSGSHIEKKNSYTSDGNVPKIKGGEFIVGKFEDTLPFFFSESRPKASIINFDADLYSSTICALNFSKKVMDKDTILIFDEFITHESWEQDEFKALNEFCSINHYKYQVIAISFFTKQVAVKLIGI